MKEEMDKIIKLSPVFKHVLWGGNKLRTVFGYDEGGDDIGECWAISAHENGDCLINGGKYDGMKLSEVWKNHPECFGRISKGNNVFPLLIKIIDAKDDLSIQVHPDNEYAYMNENKSLGKMECWYIIDCEPGTKIIIGHNCESREELCDCIVNDKWDKLIREIPVKKGDFFQIDPGTVHAIKGGTLILETQQSSDITYRLYDYDRISNGKKRETHKSKCMDIINVPDHSKSGFNTSKNAYMEKLIETDFYNVWKATLKEDKIKSLCLSFDASYILASVIDGRINVCGTKMKKGDNFIITNGNCDEVELAGCGEMIFSCVS